MDQYANGVIIGRFQIDDIHAGHGSIIDRVLLTHRQVLILLGTTETLLTFRNPLNFKNRELMIRKWLQKHYPTSEDNVTILPIADCKSDTVWSDNVDTLIKMVFPLGSARIYGGRDSFIPHYTGRYPALELNIEDNVGVSATEERKNIGKRVLNSGHFRAGIIYATQNKYPSCFPCVDLAVTRQVGDNVEVLMGSKDGKTYCFPGGFVNPTDNCYEEAALREFNEEIGGISLEGEGYDELQYVTSSLIDDWRYPGPERIMSILFTTKHHAGVPFPIEEFVDVKWIPVENNVEVFDMVSSSHQEFFNELVMRYLK